MSPADVILLVATAFGLAVAGGFYFFAKRIYGTAEVPVIEAAPAPAPLRPVHMPKLHVPKPLIVRPAPLATATSREGDRPPFDIGAAIGRLIMPSSMFAMAAPADAPAAPDTSAAPDSKRSRRRPRRSTGEVTTRVASESSAFEAPRLTEGVDKL